MDIEDERIAQAVRNTEILRSPRQTLSTFGTTNVYYYLVTEPAYSELVNSGAETVVREGRVIAEKPRIVTPFYLSRLEGFGSDARKYFEMLINTYGPSAPGLFYTYKNEPSSTSIVSGSLPSVVNRINQEIDRKGEPLSSIIKGEDALWDVSLMKFIFEMTGSSVRDNLSQMQSLGLLNQDRSGVPLDARLRINELFRQVEHGEREPRELKDELARWGLFEEYEDRFLGIFRRKSAA